MDNTIDFFQDLYTNFNNRKIELVIAKMTDDVKWANGMDGGFVYGKNEVRHYWIRQFAMISSNVTPLKIDREENTVKINVHQIVHDLGGRLIVDEFVSHIFHLRDNKIAEFSIGDKIKK